MFKFSFHLFILRLISHPEWFTLQSFLDLRMRILRCVHRLLFMTLFLIGLIAQYGLADAPVACDQSLIEKTTTDVILDVTRSIKLSCPPDKLLKIGDNAWRMLECDSEGWFEPGFGNAKIKATDSIKASCISKNCHPRLINKLGYIEENMDDGKYLKDIACKSNIEEMLITFESYSRIHSKISCDNANGWKNEAGISMFAANSEFTVECIEKTCDKNRLTGMAQIDFESGPPATIKCRNPQEVLLIDDAFFNKITCEKRKKWKEGNFEIEGHQFKVDCVVKACHKNLLDKIDPEIVDKSAPNKLRCKDKAKELRTKFGWRHNDEFVCDISRGWLTKTNGVEEKIAGADARIEVLCVYKTCDESLIVTPDPQKLVIRLINNNVELSCTGTDLLEVDRQFYDKLICIKSALHNEWRTYEKTNSSPRNIVKIGRSTRETLKVYCVEQECHRDLLTLGEGVKRIEKSSLTCDDSSMKLHIKGTSIYAAQLTCSLVSGWTDGTITVKSNTDELSVECIGEVCDKRNIVANPEVSHREPNNKLKHNHVVCANSKRTLYISNKLHDSVWCEERLGWRSESGLLNIGSKDKIRIECRIKGKTKCDQMYINGDMNELDFDFPPKSAEVVAASDMERNAIEKERLSRKVLTCKKSKYLRANDHYPLNNRLHCKIARNLWEELTLPIKEDSKVKVECVELMKKTREITCTKHKSDTGEDAPRVLIHNNKKYTTLRCSLFLGWLDEKGVLIANSDTKITVSCEEYCLFEYANSPRKNERIKSTVKNGELRLETVDKIFAIQPINADRPIKHPADLITCTYRGGWMVNGVQIYAWTQHHKLKVERTEVCKFKHAPGLLFDRKERHLKCRFGWTLTVKGVPSPPLKCDPYPGWHDYEEKYSRVTRHQHDRFIELDTNCTQIVEACEGRRVKIARTVEKLGPGVYNCKNTKLSDPNNAMTLNGRFVHSELLCDSGRGWTDSDGNWLANANDMAKISCENTKCKASYGDCAASPKLLPGYACTYKDFDDSPDPNIRFCNNEKQIHFNGDTAVNGLRCGDNGSWHEIDDTSKTPIVKDPKDVLCVRKRCTKCHRPRIIYPDGYETTEALFEQGSSDTCSTARCPDNLWLVRIGRNDVEYAGEVVCSSNEDSYGKWILDDDKSVVEKAICIDQVKSCAISFKSSSGSWQGCEVRVDGSKETCECPNGMTLFYKQKDELAFRRSKVVNLECDRKRGWIVRWGGEEVAQINKSDIVICAYENPLQLTTTTRKTPITKIKTACDICPSLANMLQQCDTCSQKTLDINLENSADNEKCIAKSGISGQFLTELQGEIKGFLECAKSDKVWKHNGKEIGKFAALRVEKEEPIIEYGHIFLGLACLVILSIILFILYKVFISVRNPENPDLHCSDSHLKSNRDKTSKNNAETPEDVVVEAASKSRNLIADLKVENSSLKRKMEIISTHLEKEKESNCSLLIEVRDLTLSHEKTLAELEALRQSLSTTTRIRKKMK
ncbi:hypothetical protein PRIPAC_71796 [Pristionchus pacificus]|uniref:Uncharacterized protein n=1 Tax=Pristionchus pacificus TaxID=54126 RepID=A0A2A6CFN5_PRIPA|nr:hypothetical protein PRIPAC_71796 [Pristionchus pacificus]|eukprot:PDM76910.1 hypothetical protein PRIPAC_42305 [Pristionchus pacificus]